MLPVAVGSGPNIAAAVLFWDRLLVNGREHAPFYAEFASVVVHAPPAALEQGPSQGHPAGVPAFQAAAVEPARPSWYYMPVAERQPWVADLISKVVTKVLGKEVVGSQPLMVSGLDSLGMQCRLVVCWTL